MMLTTYRNSRGDLAVDPTVATKLSLMSKMHLYFGPLVM